MTEGQELALRQLREVAEFSVDAVELVGWKCPEGGWLTVEFSLRTSHLKRTADGLPLRDRERFVAAIPDVFPFRPPSVWTQHTRFAGFPHVQWGRQLCLYQSVGTEWDPADGVFGFLVRLEEWLDQGARGELDPIGAPLHPPAVYAESDQMVIPRCDTPPVSDTHWFGLARIRPVTEHRVDIVGWSPSYGEDVEPPVGAAVLLSTTMPWEFPRTVADLIRLLEERGVSKPRLLLTLQLAVLRNPKDTGLYVFLGAPMRGVRGVGVPRQHLSAWYLAPHLATGLRLTLEQYSDHAKLQEIGAQAEALIWDWAENASIAWCGVREDRPEIVTRRDHASPAAWFKGKSVQLWGCGALGSHIAEFIVRAGVRRLVLCDGGTVAPGILVRQQFEDADLGEGKAAALKARLLRIRHDVEIDARSGDLVNVALSRTELWADRPDLVIDSTGSRTVLKVLEKRWAASELNRIPLASLVVGPAAERGLAAVVRAAHSGGPLDAVRAAKLEACKNRRLIAFRDEFWPADSATGRRFQPEPGCSDPTFVGSAADIAILAGSMLNVVARDLQTEQAVSCFAHFVTRPDVTVDESQDGHSHHSWPPEATVVDAIRNYEVRLSADAWNNILRLIEITRRKRGRLVETGGLLLGERDDSARVIWVTEASDPPPDSRLSRDAFVCGVQGTADLDAQRRAETLGAVRFVGMWHTHPDGPPSPSAVDLNGMHQLVTSIDPPIAEALMVIVGFTPSSPTAAAYLFGREDFAGPGGTGIRLGPKRGWRHWTSRMVGVTSRFIGFRGGNGEQAF